MMWLLAATSFAGNQPVTFELKSRPVSDQEIDDGAPAGTVFDWFTTTDNDIISISFYELSPSFYQHGQGIDFAQPQHFFGDVSPALNVDSWFSTPGSTLMLGNGFDMQDSRESLWGDLDNNGAVTDFQFGRLTVPAGSTANFRGDFRVAREDALFATYSLDFVVDESGIFEWGVSEPVLYQPTQPTPPPPSNATPIIQPPIPPSEPETVPEVVPSQPSTSETEQPGTTASEIPLGHERVSQEWPQANLTGTLNPTVVDETQSTPGLTVETKDPVDYVSLIAAEIDLSLSHGGEPVLRPINLMIDRFVPLEPVVDAAWALELTAIPITEVAIPDLQIAFDTAGFSPSIAPHTHFSYSLTRSSDVDLQLAASSTTLVPESETMILVLVGTSIFIGFRRSIT